MNSQIKNFRVRRLEQSEVITTDKLVIEEPLEIRLNNKPLAVVMRTPGHDLDLAFGFLLSEGILFSFKSDDWIDKVKIDCARDELELEIPNVVNCMIPGLSVEEIKKKQRRIFSTSSCGICGRESLDRVFIETPPLHDEFTISSSDLIPVPRKLRARQISHTETGGLHAAALFTRAGKVVAIYEDIGRHNAVDKVIGWALKKGIYPLPNYGLMVSGRLSFEMAQKALAAGIPFVAAVSAASSLAVELGEEAGMTLVGFLRGEQAVIYTGIHRVKNHNTETACVE